MATSIPNELTHTGNNQLKVWTDGCKLTSDDRFGRPAIYNATTKTFKQNVDIEDSASYCMQSYMITSGPLKGCKAIILVPAGSFRLLDLPREIRNMIYQLLVTDDDSIKLVTYNPSGGSKRVVQQSYRYASKRGWNPQTKKPIQDPTDSMSLLRVNRQIMEEEIEVLYGSNIFRFDHAGTIKLFAKLHTKSLRHLRSVELDFDPRYAKVQNRLPSELKGAQQVLWQATNLRQVRIGHAMLCKSNLGADTMVDAFLPLLKKLQNFKSMQEISVQMEEVLHIEQCDCAWCQGRRLGEEKDLFWFRHNRCHYSKTCVGAQTVLAREVKNIVAEKLPLKR